MQSLTFIHGEPKVGKSHTAVAGWPDPLHVDTAYTQRAFREMETLENEAGRGETWPVVQKLLDDPSQHYHYLTTFRQPEQFVKDGHSSVIVDNISDLRTMAAAEWAERNDTDWPAQAQWGSVNNMLARFVEGLRLAGNHVVVIAQLKNEYQNDSATGNRIPDTGIDLDYMTDFELEITRNSDNEREILMHANRQMDTTALPEMPHSLGSSVALEDLFALAGVPESEWSTG